MKEVFKVKKWGGENAAELEKSPNNIVADFRNGTKQAVVVSAIRGPEFNTTDKLISIGKLLSKDEIDIEKVKSKLKEIKDFHLSIVDEKFKGDRLKVKNLIKYRFEELSISILEYLEIDENERIIPSKENDYLINTKSADISILGFGEILSAEIQSALLNNMGVDGLKSKTVDFKGITEKVDLDGGEDIIFIQLAKEISQRVISIIEKNKIPVIPGYIPGFQNGIENAIGRGYSDATASMSAVGLAKIFDVILEIQKSVKGMLSVDPGLLDSGKPKLIQKIDYLTAKEITGIRGAQAKLLHNQVLRRELQEAGIVVHLFDPFKNTKGTIISREKDKNSSGVEFIGGRDNVTFFSVSSGKMSSKGVIADVFSIVKEYCSVDIISTSETEISFTIDSGLNTNRLEEISTKIRNKLGIKENGYEDFVKYEPFKALVFCVGQNLSNNLGSLGRAASALSNAGINIEMVSQGIMERAMIFGIQGNKLKQAINVLHDEFI
ncbi:MAG: hypothetical protein Q8K30_01605 [Candidatus Gracilibacteria bacterium]|nr:hypothetical protein [Candidatus Gracilibacteria bacterium]